MILLFAVADSPELIETNCSACRASVPIPCVPRVNTARELDLPIAGTLNTASCPACGTRVTSERPVHTDMPELGIVCLGFLPLDMLERDSVSEGLLVDSQYEQVFYSLGELARQVQARIRLSQFAPSSLKTDEVSLGSR